MITVAEVKTTKSANQVTSTAQQQPEQAEKAPKFFIDLRPRLFKLPEFKNKEQINVRYPLLPPYAFAHIYWDKNQKELVYKVEEQLLSETEQELFKLIQLGLEEMINISFRYAKKSDLIINYLEKNVQSILAELGAKVSTQSYLKIMYYIYRNFIGLNKIEPIINDPYIEDIECNGTGTPIYIVHRKYQNLKTNIIYKDASELVDFVEKLAQKTGRYVSYAKPLLDGTLLDGSRVNATYTSDVTTHGPTFTIRKFTKEPLTPLHLINYGTADAATFAYVWMAIENKFNVITIGETASGKTTFLNSILQFVPSEARIVSIEDTREINLAHQNWIPAVARVGFGIPNLLGKQYGEITLFDLLRETFRQNPDYVVVGEVRGQETYVLFQGMASIPGNEKVMVLQNDQPKLIPIEQINDVKDCKTISYNPKTCEVKILPVAAHITHPSRKELVKITTKTGREITATPDHSLFTLNDKNELLEIPAGNLQEGDNMMISSKIPCGYADIKTLNLIDIIPNIRIYAPEKVREASHKLGYYQASSVCGIVSITDYYSPFKKANPASMNSETFFNLMGEAGMVAEYSSLKVKLLRKSRPIDSEVEINDEFLRLLGYYISEGTVNFSGKNSSFALYSKNLEVLEDMRKCMATVTKINPVERTTTGFGTSQELKVGNKIYSELLNALCGKGSSNKHIPSFMFGLSKERIGKFLAALYTGDGYTTKHSFGYNTISKELAQQVQQLLLVYGIVASLYKSKTKKNKEIYGVVFYKKDDMDEFLKYTEVLGKKKFEMKKFALPSRKVRDAYVDKVKKIEKITLKKPIPVYDLSVPGTENFLSATGVILHNSGHSSYSTFHAASVETLVKRLETPPINLPASLVDSLDIIINVVHLKDQKRNIRRMTNLKEVIEVKQQLGTVDSNTLFEWDPIKDAVNYNGHSHILSIISKRTGIPIAKLEAELQIRTKILQRMIEKNILNHSEFTKVINLYYKEPKIVIRELGIK
ncbi:hypothetical protein CMO88_03705 [Candidatus Woesearchaeota archaeon]|nr:hypothetical protein [Candidatus Woesearchaeota archaeon]